MVDRAILADIHHFWFGPLSGFEDFPAERSKAWFTPSDAFDEEIRQRYGRYIRPAAERHWDLAALSREERIGLVVLLDQFPRNIFRESGESFAYDAAARTIARSLVAEGTDRYFWIERPFLFLPFEHSEDVADQDFSTLLYAGLAVHAPASLVNYLRMNLDFATKHRDLIRRFGRFPHRNRLLGRTSTQEEEAFLAEHGRGY
jgi:uncharacterized protein (DUF924 family)